MPSIIEWAQILTTKDEREQSFVITDPSQHDNPIVFFNHSFLRISGYTRPEILGHNCRLLQGEDTNPATVRALRDAIDQARRIEVDILNYTKTGNAFWNRLRIRPACDDEGKLLNFVGVQVKISESDVNETPRDF